jgi:hypothetical protein
MLLLLEKIGGIAVEYHRMFSSDPKYVDDSPSMPIKTKMFYAFSVRSSRSGYESDSMMLQRVQSI